MTTNTLTITSDWLQVSDGSEDKVLQVLQGAVFLAEADDKPEPNAKGYLVRANALHDFATLTTPGVVWCRAAVFDAAEIVI